MPITENHNTVDINKRKMINGKDADVMQLYPMKHLYAWDAYNVGNANHWLPTEISMQKDIEQWKSKDVLSEWWETGFWDCVRIFLNCGLYCR